jgi:hypothetical protein
MNHEDYISFASEIQELEVLLAGIPKENVISRMGLESRLKDAKDADVLNQIVHKHLTARFHVIQVGQGRPRFTLQKMADISEQT